MHKFIELLKRFRRDERGAFLAMFGVLAVVLIATAGATVDFTSVQNARTRAQVALDAAALALQPEIYKTNFTTAQIRAAAEALMVNRLNDPKIVASVTSAAPDLVKGTLTLTATLKAPLIFVALVGVKEMNMTLVSQATRGAQNLEVAVALDVTGSMQQDDKIGALRDAASDMVDTLVLDQQTPTYTKMALIPYSMGVNVGSYAASARGAIPAAKAVTAVSWLNATKRTITAITRANPAEVTTSQNHGYVDGDIVWISGITGGASMTALNNRFYTVTRKAAKKFTLNGINTSGFANAWSGGGKVQKCLVAACQLQVTSAAHGFANGDKVYLTGVGGTTALNGNIYAAASVVANTLVLSGTDARTLNGSAYLYQPYTSGGSAWCVKYGCQYFYFQNPAGSWKLYDVSTCVTERFVANKYTDAAPSTTYVGLNYPSDGNDCLSAQIVPLSSDKTMLKNTISNLVAEGSTAGQIGLGWAWYMLAPNFGSLWPSANRPAAYLAPNVIKVLVLMTDGSFNSPYCNGVIAADALSGSGSSDDHINCNATNGSPFDQAKAMCDGIKSPATGIIVYTVGFDIGDQTQEKDVMSYCASDSSKYFLAENDQELSAAFDAIAQDIAQLRLSE